MKQQQGKGSKGARLKELLIPEPFMCMGVYVGEWVCNWYNDGPIFINRVRVISDYTSTDPDNIKNKLKAEKGLIKHWRPLNKLF